MPEIKKEDRLQGFPISNLSMPVNRTVSPKLVFGETVLSLHKLGNHFLFVFKKHHENFGK